MIDIAPTLCELAGIEGDYGFEGKSMVNLIKGIKEPDRVVLSQGNMWGLSGNSWIRGDFKLILFPGKKNQLYNICGDPVEKNNIADQEKLIKKNMLDELRKYLKNILNKQKKGETPDLTEKQIEHLRSLGYVQ